MILAQYAGGNVSTYADVSVASGQVVTVVLPAQVQVAAKLVTVSPGIFRRQVQTGARVMISGAWSLGLPTPAVGFRSSRSTTAAVQRAATDAVPRARSIRRPQPRWKAPCR